MSKSKIIRKILYGIRAVMGTLFVKEIFMAEKFNSTIVDSEWYKYKSVCPGGYAVDYAFLYTLYRILTSIKPNNILEFGLGQTSKMIHQYANYYNVNAVTIEHDQHWEEFFNEGREGNYNIKTRFFDLENTLYKGCDTSTYKDCCSQFVNENEKFDFILLDGGPYLRNPENNRFYKYARPQIIDFARFCLKEDFVILLDDYGIIGIQNTVKEMFNYFDENDIDYIYKEYSGVKRYLVIATPKYRFLTTL